MSIVIRVVCGALMVCATTWPGLAAQAARARAEPGVLFTGVRVIVGDGTVIENGAFLVQRDMIIQVGKPGELHAPKGTMTVHLHGRTCLPPSVNAHSHL